MSTDNENKPNHDDAAAKDDVSEKKELSEQSETELSDKQKHAPNERLKKLKSSLEKIVLSLKQPTEENFDDEEEPVEAVPEKKNEKVSENPEYFIKDIFADVEYREKDSAAVQTPHPAQLIYEHKEETSPAAEKVKNKTADTVSAENPKTAAEPEKSETDAFTAQAMTPEQLWKELPAYNLFEDTPDTETAAPLKKEILDAVKKESEKSSKIKTQPSVKVSSPVTETVAVKPVESVNVLDATYQDKDLREGAPLPVSYHCDTAQPFIVMAGKFTRTLKAEYEAVREYEKNTPPVKHQKKKTAVPVHTENTSAPAKTQPVLKVITSDKKVTASAVKNAPQTPPVLKEVTKPQTGIKIKTEKPKTEEEPKPHSSAPKPKKKQKKNFKINFRDLIDDAAEQKSPNGKAKKLLDDYNNEKDADDIRTEIERNLHMILIRTAILSVTWLLSVIAAIIAQCTPLFSEAMRTGWLFYGIISFILFTVAVISARLPIVNGLMPLRHLKGNSDTAAAVTSFAVAVQSVTALCTPHVFTNGTYHIYVPLAITALLLNSIGKLLLILRTLDNFRFLSKPYPKYAGKIYTDMKNAEKMVSEFPAKTNLIAYMKRSRFMSNFLRLSYEPDPSEEMAARIAPVTTIVALLFGIAYGCMTLDFAGGVTSFALTSCIGTPMISLIVLNIPMKLLCRNALGAEAMISGYGAVQQFCDTNAIMVDVSQLYPPGTVTLSGMKVFRQSKLNDAMQAGAAVMYAVNGTMSYAFENIVQCKKEQLPRVESVVYEDERGLLAWVNKQRVLIGNRTLLEAHNIKVPPKELEDKYLKTGNRITYISISGELIAMFILSYRTDREIADGLRELEENGVSFVIRTIDPNVTKENIAEKFGLFHRCITVLPTGLGNICHEVTSSVEERSRAYLVTRGKLSAFAKAISGCIKMKSTTMIAKLLQGTGILFGLLIFTLISFVSGFQKLGSLEILIYIVFWAAATIIAAMIKK